MTVDVSINCAQNAYSNFISAIVKNHKLSYTDYGKTICFNIII